MSKLTVRYRNFTQSNNDLPGGYSYNVVPGAQQVNFPPISEQDLVHTGKYLLYSFAFSSTNDPSQGLIADKPRSITVPASGLRVTGWYQQIGDGDGVGVYVSAFSETKDRVWADSPIESVNSSPWQGGSLVPTTAGVDIVAKNSISSSVGLTFRRWELLGAFMMKDVSVNGATLHVEKGISVWALAIYEAALPGLSKFQKVDWERYINIKDLIDKAQRELSKVYPDTDPNPLPPGPEPSPPGPFERLNTKLNKAGSPKPTPRRTGRRP